MGRGHAHRAGPRPGTTRVNTMPDGGATLRAGPNAQGRASRTQGRATLRYRATRGSHAQGAGATLRAGPRLGAAAPRAGKEG